ncbi:MAG: hypothetical protein LKE29_09075 [Acidaminococcaceae bacterium]|nr:hypothetical protein [Acidaminococcaceae bacterium]
MTVILLLVTTYRIFFGRLVEAVDDDMKNIATVLVQNTKIREMISEGKSNKQVDDFCDDCISKINNLNILAICDKNGICLYHSDRSYVGKHIAGGDDGPMVLTHQSYYSNTSDSLGEQHRYYHAIEDKNGNFYRFPCNGYFQGKYRQHKRSSVFVLCCDWSGCHDDYWDNQQTYV